MTSIYYNKGVAVYRQMKQAIEGGPVTCGCAAIVPLWRMHRCYYCGEFYCSACAPEHFGKTREQYLRETAEGATA